jgi:vacuolar-type H+-ATPase subunit E/Vma4
MTALKADRVMPALEPVRAELLRRAGADAQQMVADAEGEATRILKRAHDTARRVIEQARAAGESAAAAVVAEQGTALRRGLRRELLTTQDNAYQQWRRLGRQAVLRLRDEPGHSQRRDMLRKTAYAVLGADARVSDAPDGGVVAELDHRRLDLSLSAIAERALDRIAPEVDGLWT